MEEIFICGRGYFCSFENLMVIFVVSSNVVVIFAVFPLIFLLRSEIDLFNALNSTIVSVYVSLECTLARKHY